MAGEHRGRDPYRHLNMPPGDYLVYARRDTVMSAWKRVQVKAGELLALDLTIDPANTGEVVVTLPEAAQGPGGVVAGPGPAKADLPDLGLGSSHYFSVATVKMGEKTVKVRRPGRQVPGGPRDRRGRGRGRRRQVRGGHTGNWR